MENNKLHFCHNCHARNESSGVALTSFEKKKKNTNPGAFSIIFVFFFLCLFFCLIFFHIYVDYVNKRNRLGHFEGFQVDICHGINTNKILLFLYPPYVFLFTDISIAKSRCLGFWMYISHRPPPLPPLLLAAKYRYEFSVSHSTTDSLLCWFLYTFSNQLSDLLS